MNSKEIFNLVIAGVGTFLTYIFGSWDTALIVLVACMAIDYISGVIAAAINQKVDSKIGYKGLLKKCMILLILIVAVLLDRMLNEGTWVFRTLVAYFYIANEGISILENCGKCGLPLPEKLINVFEQLKEQRNEK